MGRGPLWLEANRSLAREMQSSSYRDSKVNALARRPLDPYPVTMRLLPRLIAMVLALASCGCSQYAPVRVMLFGETSDHSMLDAVLTSMSGIGMPFVRGTTDPDVIIDFGVDPNAPCIDASTPHWIHIQPACQISTMPPYDTYYTQYTIAHALGHLVGMSDLPSGHGVMEGGPGFVHVAGVPGQFVLFTDGRPSTQTYTPTPADIAEFQRTHP